MRRRAILIGDNNATSTRLQGVNADIDRLRQHLTSELGGAWEKEEISWFKAPTVSRLRTRLEFVCSEQPDFLMIAFSGHGFENEQNESFIYLSDNETFAVKKLQVAVDRQVTIVDACRVLVPGTLAEGVIKTAKVDDVSGFDEFDCRSSCRARFDAQLCAVPAGRALLQSCSPGETSSDYAAALYGATDPSFHFSLHRLYIILAEAIASAPQRRLTSNSRGRRPRSSPTSSKSSAAASWTVAPRSTTTHGSFSVS